jgi:hypothetical protein
VTVYVTAIRPASTRTHEGITEIRWLDSRNSTSKTMSVPAAIAWLRKGNTLRVAGTDRYSDVQIVEASPPYLRTVADDTDSDNLLQLPRY